MRKEGHSYQCCDCEYNSTKKPYIVSHIQANHLPNFPGYTCPDCGSHSATVGGYDKHLQRIHNVSLAQRKLMFSRQPLNLLIFLLTADNSVISDFVKRKCNLISRKSNN